MDKTSQCKKYTPSVSKLYERFESLLFELEDIGGELDAIAEDTEYDPERIADIQIRQNDDQVSATWTGNRATWRSAVGVLTGDSLYFYFEKYAALGAFLSDNGDTINWDDGSNWTRFVGR